MMLNPLDKQKMLEISYNGGPELVRCTGILSSSLYPHYCTTGRLKKGGNNVLIFLNEG